VRVLVLGGTRFIGAAAVRALVAGGWPVTVFHRGETEAPLPAAVEHIHGDRDDAVALARALERVEPTVVLDMITSAERQARATVGLLAGRTPRLVLASSIDVYRAYDRLAGRDAGPPDPVPLAEDAPLRTSRFPRRDVAPGVDDYDKLLVERAYVEDPRLAVTCLRLPFVFGPGDYRRRVQGLLELLRSDGDVVLSPAEAAWRCTRAHVDDVAAAIAAAVADERAAGETFNLGDPMALSTEEWTRRVGELVGWRGQLRLDPNAPPALAWAQDLVVDTSRLRRVLGFAEPLGLALGLQRTVESAPV